MDLLITFVVLSLGFLIFGSLFYGVARVFAKRKHDFGPYADDRKRSVHVRINKSQNIYSFK